jgi:hypothetical protein
MANLKQEKSLNSKKCIALDVQDSRNGMMHEGKKGKQSNAERKK